MSALREVGPGNHFLGAAHTQANFEDAFYRSSLADSNSFEQWTEEGGTDCAQRANKQLKKMLNAYEAPPLDPAIDEALLAFMEQRKNSFPDMNY
jgi:trimethylamine--corrinoid protein Co-methyltransferase